MVVFAQGERCAKRVAAFTAYPARVVIVAGPGNLAWETAEANLLLREHTSALGCGNGRHTLRIGCPDSFMRGPTTQRVPTGIAVPVRLRNGVRASRDHSCPAQVEVAVGVTQRKLAALWTVTSIGSDRRDLPVGLAGITGNFSGLVSDEHEAVLNSEFIVDENGAVRAVAIEQDCDDDHAN